MRVFNQYTNQMEEVPDEPLSVQPSEQPSIAPPEQPQQSFGFVPLPADQPLDPRVEQAMAFADAETRGEGGGVSVDLTAQPQPAPVTGPAPLGATSDPGVPLADLVNIASARRGGGGGPLTKQTLSREITMAPQTPEDIEAAKRLQEQGQALSQKEQALVDAQKQASLERQEHFLNEQELLDARQRDFDRKLQERKQVMQERADGYGKLVQEKRAEVESAKIDPDALWKETGGVGRIFAAIAIGLGQIGASLKGTRNVALDIVENTIERNVQAQAAHLQKNKELLADAKDSYAQSMNALGDEEAAAGVYRDQLYTDFIRRVAAAKEATQEEDKRMALDEMMAQAESKRLANAQESMQKYLGTAVIEQTQRSGGGGRRNPLKDYQEALKVKKLEQEVLGTKPPTGEQKQDQKTIPGVGTASSVKGADQVRSSIDFGAKAIANLEELQRIAKGASVGETFAAHLPGGRIISPDVSAAGDLAGDTGLLLAKAKDPDSVIRKEEEERERKKVRDPHKVGKGSTLAGYDLQIKQARQAVRSKAAANGLDPDLAEDILNANIARLRGSGSSASGQGGGFRFGEP